MNDELQSLIEPIVVSFEYDLWGLEYLTQGRYSTLKIYIDSEKGVDVDDCAGISRQVGALLDVEDLIPSKYTLEVSSPGLDRRLFTIEQFDLFKGATVKLTLRSAYEGKRKFRGILCGVEEGDVVLRVGDEEYLFPFEDVDRTIVVPVFK
ncbi:MAG: ribosome maturation factor RimP [Candidatus Azotimanducaceae bacterium]|jgi:ribosome maturation factor RimP